MPPYAGLAVAPRVGESSRSLRAGSRPRGVQVSALAVGVVGVDVVASREGVVGAMVLVGEGLGVVCRNGEGDRGDSGRRKGEARGEP